MKKNETEKLHLVLFGNAAQYRVEEYVTHTTQRHTVPIQSGHYCVMDCLHWTIDYIALAYQYPSTLLIDEQLRHYPVYNGTIPFQHKIVLNWTSTTLNQSISYLSQTVCTMPRPYVAELPRNYTHIAAMLMRNEASPIHNGPVQHDTFTYLRLSLLNLIVSYHHLLVLLPTEVVGMP